MLATGTTSKRKGKPMVGGGQETEILGPFNRKHPNDDKNYHSRAQSQHGHI